VDAAIAKVVVDEAGTKAGFHRVFAVPDDPAAIDEALSLARYFLVPAPITLAKA
jgi:hypothetical protein